MSIHEANQYIKERQSFYRSTKFPVPSARELIQALGYDRAKKMGILEAYKDASYISFRRPKDSWDKNWSHLIKDT
jgi:hypothetical protein